MTRFDPVSPDVDHPILNPIFDRFRDADREPPELYRILGIAPAMLRAWVDMAWPLRMDATSSRALRELMIMRVAVLTNASFEWEAHWPAATSAGVRVAQLAALNDWATSEEFSPTERIALRIVDEMIIDGSASAAAVTELRSEFSDGECIELILTSSYYSCVSHTLLSLGIGAGSQPFDDERHEIFARLTD
jgi:alkylhydroperoxidase family enzyme